MSPNMTALFSRFENAYHASASDDYNERASYSMIKRHYDAAQKARAELVAAIENLEKLQPTLPAIPEITYDQNPD